MTIVRVGQVWRQKRSGVEWTVTSTQSTEWVSIRSAKGTRSTCQTSVLARDYDLIAIVSPREPGHENCPDNPCPGHFPYCEGTGMYRSPALPPLFPLAKVREALKGPLTVMSLNEGERVMDALAPLERALPELMSAYHHVRHYMVSDGEDWRDCPRCKALLEGAC